MFPDRFFDVGIAEQHAVTFAAGLAAGGLKPVVAVYSSFLQRAYDQGLHAVCTQNQQRRRDPSGYLRPVLPVQYSEYDHYGPEE